MQTFVNEKTEFEVNSSTYRKPVQAVTYVRRDWIELTPRKNEAGCNTHHRLQLGDQAISYSSHQTVTAVQPAGDKRMD